MTMLFQVWRDLIWAKTTKVPSINLTNFTLSSYKGSTLFDHLFWRYKLRKGGLNNLTALLPLSRILGGYISWVHREDPWNQSETISSAQGCNCGSFRAVKQQRYCHSRTNRGDGNLESWRVLLQHPVQCKQHFLIWPSDILSLEVSEEEEGGEVSTPPDLLVEGKVSVINQTL